MEPLPVYVLTVLNVNFTTIVVRTPFSLNDIVDLLNLYVVVADVNGWNKNQRFKRLILYLNGLASFLYRRL